MEFGTQFFISEVEKTMKKVEFKKDDIICRQGEIGNCMYCIKSGSVAVFTLPL